MPTHAVPPVLCFARVLAYAVLDASVEYTGRRTMLVDGHDLGPVPRLALCQNLGDDDDIMLFHCDESWNVLAAGGGEKSLDGAKASAEVAYRGVSAKWVDTGVSEAAARHWLEQAYPESLCSFCGKLPYEFEASFVGHRAGICDH